MCHTLATNHHKPQFLIVVLTMKLSLALLVAYAATASGFGVAPAFSRATVRTTVILEASRKKQKIASRSAWAESRGASGGATTPVDSAEAGLMASDEGLEYVKLVHPNGSSSEIYLYGGDVTSYKDADGVEYIAVRPDAKMDGSKPISGGLSHCFPQVSKFYLRFLSLARNDNVASHRHFFAQFGPGEIQQHGFARNVNWTVKSMTDTSVVLELAPSDYTKEMWDKEFLCTFTVELEDDQLATKMLVENKGEEAFDFQAALHSYFTVSALDNLEITGSFEGKEFLNKLVGDEGEMQTEDRSSITIGEEYDRVYKGVNDPILKDSGTGKAVSNCV